MAYRFTRLWSRFLSLFGLAVIVVGVVGALAIFLLDHERIGLSPELSWGVSLLLRFGMAIACAAIGFLLGGCLMVASQLLQFLLSTGFILRRVDARLRAWEGKLIQLFEEQPAVRKRGRPGL
jgi:hypothetical protein